MATIPDEVDCLPLGSSPTIETNTFKKEEKDLGCFSANSSKSKRKHTTHPAHLCAIPGIVAFPSKAFATTLGCGVVQFVAVFDAAVLLR